MAEITFHNGTPSNPALFVAYVDMLLFDATLDNLTSTGFTGTLGKLAFQVSGTGLSYTTILGTSYLTGGTLQGVDVLVGDVLSLRVADIGLSVPLVTAAVQAENAGTDLAAVENLFMTLNYRYFGNQAADVLPDNLVSGDNVTLQLKGNDYVSTGGGNDNFFLGAGNDTAYGGDGNDSLQGADGDDLIHGENGKDVLGGGNGLDTIYGGVRRDRLRGDAGDDVLYGDDGNDFLFGGGNDDTLFGGAGADQLSGGRGKDVMFGGSGADTFVFSGITEIGRGANGDTIGDFRRGTDRIDLSAMTLQDGMTDRHISFDGKVFSGDLASARFVLRDGIGQLQIDWNGDSRADAVIYLPGISDLSSVDLIL